MTECCILLTTFSDENEAKNLIKYVLDKKLVACVQLHNINSMYLWDNEICNDNEILVAFKTTTKHYDALAKIIQDKHSYDVPEIIQVPITTGSLAYLSWIQEVTTNQGDGS